MYIIDKVKWHTGVEGNPETRGEVLLRFKLLAQFLDENGLTNTPILSQDPSENFQVSSDNLTSEGLEFMQFAYDKWLQSLDRGKAPASTLYLEKKLNELRSSS